MMKDSAAELVIASKVAFIDSEESWHGRREKKSKKKKLKMWLWYTYNALLFDNVDGRIDIVLSCERNTQERIHDC